jgi:GT2 family glycosyltransferase
MDLGIVVPTLNSVSTLAHTLLHLQVYQAAGAEVVVVDGGSQDATKHQAENAGFRVLSCPGNMYRAINYGLSTLSQTWLTWINSDDILYNIPWNRLVTRTELGDVYYGRVDFIDSRGRFLHTWRSASPKTLLHLYRCGLSPLLQQGTIFRKEMFESLGGFDETYAYVADADFWWRALNAGWRFVRCNSEPRAAFRLHSRQLSFRDRNQMAAEHKALNTNHEISPNPCYRFLLTARYRLSNLDAYFTRTIRRMHFPDYRNGYRSYDFPNS